MRHKDFVAAFTTLKLDPKQQDNIFKKMQHAKEKWMEFIDISFLSEDFKEAYKAIVVERFSRLKEVTS